MSALKEMPWEDLDIEYITMLKDFVQPVLFPFKRMWKDQRILYVGSSRGAQILEKQFPEAEVQQMDVEGILSAPRQQENRAFDYIAAAGIKSAGADICQVLRCLLSLLKPGGVVCCGVYGCAGYYGLDMLSTIIKHLAVDIKDFSNPKNFSRLKKIIHAVVERLPGNHPANHRRAFMERLKRGDQTTLRELVNISPAKIFTVPRLLECIEQSGGSFMDWVVPAFYHPGRFVENEETVKKLEALPEPERWKVAEMVNAAPPDHYFFMKKKDEPPVKIRWDSNDLYLWHPRRLPLFQWEILNEAENGNVTLPPVKECAGMDSIQLETWQVQLCRAASGTSPLDQLLVNIKESSARVMAFLKQAVEMRLLALLPPG